MSYMTKELYEWDTSDVCNWLHSKNLRSYVDNFEQNSITGYDLCFLTTDDLKNELKILSLHERYNLLKEIRKLLLSHCKI